jgi:hypothetical protein
VELDMNLRRADGYPQRMRKVAKGSIARASIVTPNRNPRMMETGRRKAQRLILSTKHASQLGRYARGEK